jgi:FkbM family methyltransferase
LREYWRNSHYRALHRFNRKLSGLPSGTSALLTLNGLKIEICDGASFLSSWDEIFVNRIYEIPRVAGRKPVLVDAGANIGLAALYWKLHFGDFTYLGFEPDPRVAACCRRNLATWGVHGKLVELALAGGEGRSSFLPDGADGGRLTSAGGGHLDVETGRLSQWLPEWVDLLKIDVEGAEAEVVRDIAPKLASIGSLFVEWHQRPGQRELGELIGTLEAAGFECHVQTARGAPTPFQRNWPHGMFTQYLNIFAVRT